MVELLSESRTSRAKIVDFARLIGKERVDEAKAIIADFHANGDAGHPLVELEVREMSDSLREEGMVSWRTLFDLRVLFKSRARRYRMMLNISFSWFGQFSGNKFDLPGWAHGRSPC
jgi:hypothetical protein